MKQYLDTSAWIALTIKSHPLHRSARDWYDGEVLSPGDLLFCRSTEQSFLRLVTQRAVMAHCAIEPMTNDEAIAFMEEVYGDPAVGYAEEPPAMRSVWFRLAKRSTASPNLWMDAYLAAFAIAGRMRMVTFDRAFKQFAGLEVTVLGAAKK